MAGYRNAQARARAAFIAKGGGAPTPTPGPTPLSARAPTVRDDAARGYAVGNFWRYNDAVYVARDVTAGAASWELLATDFTPVQDVVPSAIAAYGTTLLNSAYAGPAINVVRASDGANLDIGFVTAGSRKILDAAALDAFLAGTTGSVATLYDQSGNGNHATQSTAANRPFIGKKTIGGVRTISFMGETGNAVIHSLALPAGVSMERSTSSQYAAITPFTSQGPNAFWEVGSTSAAELLTYIDAAASVPSLQVHNGAVKRGFQARTDPSIMSVVTTLASTSMAQNNVTAATNGGAAAAVTGGQIGNTIRATGYQGRFDLGALIIYGSTHSAAQQEAIKSRLFRAFNVAPQSDVNLVYDGDSITFGRGVALGNEIASQTPALIGETFARFNYGIGGQQQASMVTGYPNRAAQAYQASKLNVLKIFAGTNDVKNNVTGANTWASAVSEMQAARTTGFQKILVATMLPRGDFTGAQEAERQAFNDLVRANWQTYADGLLDYAADPMMGAAGATSNLTLFSDGVHPTEYGDSLLAAIDAPKIKVMIAAYRSAMS